MAVVESWDIRNLHVGQRFRKRCCFMFTGEFGGILGEFGGIFLEHSDVEVCHSFAVALPSILIFNSGAFLIF